MRQLLLGAFLVATLSVAADAGVVYRFTTTSNSRHLPPRMSGVVSYESRSYRAEINSEDKSPRVLISRDGDEHVLELDGVAQTYAEHDRAAARTTTMLFHLPMSFATERLRGDAHLDLREGGKQKVAGHAAVAKILSLAYTVVANVEDVEVGAQVEAHATYWVAYDLPAPPIHQELRTGFPSIDSPLRSWFDELGGLIVGSELVVTRTIEGGPPVREETRTVVEQIETKPITPDAFAIPEGYTLALRKRDAP